MRLMYANNIVYHIGERKLLDIPNLAIHQGDRIGLIGKNGQGKTLLLNYLMGNLDHFPNVEWKARFAHLQQLNDQEAIKDTLSGGEKTLKKLKKVFSENADVLFLDEPTNNLDWEKVQRLEQQLEKFSGAFLIVSHDRVLLDRTCTTIWELDEGKVTVYSGNFSFYERQKQLEIEQQYQAHEQYIKEKNRLVERMRQKKEQAKTMLKPPSRMGNSEWQLHKGKAKGQQAKVQRVSKVIEKRMEKLDKVEKPLEWDKIKMEYTIKQPIHRKTVVSVNGLCMQIGNRTLYEIDSLKLKTNSKTAIIGANGTGKTTLITQILSNKGSVDISNNALFGYFNQALEKLPKDKTILEFVQKDSHLPQHVIRIILGRLRFIGELVHKRIQVLSGGERVKVALAKLLVGDYNVLILDEPTNHLDLESLAAIEGLIIDYPGTVLYVSHDRRFVENTADNLWILENQKVSMITGGWQEYQQQRNQPKSTDEEWKEQQILMLDTKITELISRLSVTDSVSEKNQLEEQYQQVLEKRRKLYPY